jgi:hypothetical protein
MNDNINLLRQNYCRPAAVRGNTINHLFPLEKESAEGSAFAAKAPETLLELQEFDPAGLEQTYRDESTGANLPRYTFFDLESTGKVDFEITVDSVPGTPDPGSLLAHMPFKKAQAFVKELNKPRMKAEQIVPVSAIILGMVPAIAYAFCHLSAMPSSMGPSMVLGGCATGAILAYIVSVSILNWLCPWKKLVISAEFNGILPKAARERARAAKEHFDKLYVIVDQQHCWKSALLPYRRARVLDPLLIGELTRAYQRKFYLIDQFNLTAAEQYLADEFAVSPVSLK